MVIYFVLYLLLEIILHVASGIRVETTPLSPCAFNKIAPKNVRQGHSEVKTFMYFFDLFATSNNNHNFMNIDVPNIPSGSGCNDALTSIYSPSSNDIEDNYNNEEEDEGNYVSNQEALAEHYRPHRPHRPQLRPKPTRPPRPYRPRPPKPLRPHRPHNTHIPHYPISIIEYPATTIAYPYRPEYPFRPQYPVKPDPNRPVYSELPTTNKPPQRPERPQNPQRPNYGENKPVTEEVDDVQNIAWRPTGIVGGSNGYIWPLLQDLSHWNLEPASPFGAANRRRDRTDRETDNKEGIVSSFIKLLWKK